MPRRLSSSTFLRFLALSSAGRSDSETFAQASSLLVAEVIHSPFISGIPNHCAHTTRKPLPATAPPRRAWQVLPRRRANRRRAVAFTCHCFFLFCFLSSKSYSLHLLLIMRVSTHTHPSVFSEHVNVFSPAVFFYVFADEFEGEFGHGCSVVKMRSKDSGKLFLWGVLSRQTTWSRQTAWREHLV